jgi:hypothetical protein
VLLCFSLNEPSRPPPPPPRCWGQVCRRQHNTHTHGDGNERVLPPPLPYGGSRLVLVVATIYGRPAKASSLIHECLAPSMGLVLCCCRAHSSPISVGHKPWHGRSACAQVLAESAASVYVCEIGCRRRFLCCVSTVNSQRASERILSVAPLPAAASSNALFISNLYGTILSLCLSLSLSHPIKRKLQYLSTFIYDFCLINSLLRIWPSLSRTDF